MVDTRLYNWQPNQNHGNSDTIEHSTNRSTTSLLRFDLSGIPTNATVISAQLSLYLRSSDAAANQSRTVQLHALLLPWVENEATYTIRALGHPWTGNKGPKVGVDYQAAAAASAAVSQAGVWIPWHISPLVQQWVNNPSLNHGVILLDPNPYAVGANRFYASSEHTNSAWRPKLTITYQLPGDAGQSEGLLVAAEPVREEETAVLPEEATAAPINLSTLPFKLFLPAVAR